MVAAEAAVRVQAAVEKQVAVVEQAADVEEAAAVGLVDVAERTVARKAVAVVAEPVDQDAAPVEEAAGALTAC